jgi:aminopeptidase N
LFRREPLVLDEMAFALAGCQVRCAGRCCCPAVRRLIGASGLQPAQPEPGTQPDLQLLQRQPRGFHRTDAAGYVFWSERVLELDAINPQVAAIRRARWTAGAPWPNPTVARPAKP